MRVWRVSLSAGVAMAVAACGPGAPAPVATIGDLTVQAAFMPSSPTPDVVSFYCVVQNEGAESDTLMEVVAAFADTVTIHETVVSEGRSQMTPRDGMEIPAGAVVAMQPGGYHAMLTGLRTRLAVGDTVRMTLRFRRAGRVEVPVPVRTYTDVVRGIEETLARLRP